MSFQERSRVIATFALCGFSNISSIGIQLSAWAVWGPRRMNEFSALGCRALVSGILCDFMTACVAGNEGNRTQNLHPELGQTA